jgi:diaminopimelate decarboxylase
MNDFNYRGAELYCEDVPVAEIADAVGTPFYLYSKKTLSRHFSIFDGAFSHIGHLTCYSVKANSNLAVLNLFARLGGGADVVSGGEIFRAVRAGVDPDKIVYSGVGKTDDEIDYALRTGILMLNVESAAELERVNAIAGRLAKKAPIALRINPDVDPKTHPYISTGLKQNKFGIPIGDAPAVYADAAAKKNIDVKGAACHIGSQITQTGPFVDALSRMREFIASLKNSGIEIRYLDIGGGLGITYNAEKPPQPAEYADAVSRTLMGSGLTLLLEPGRVIVGNAGILVTRVLYTKQSPEKHFVIVDAAMNDLMRPALYDAYHRVQPVTKRREETVTADIVGPICETGDFISRGCEHQACRRNDLLAVMSAGAYGFTMSSNYNSRPRAAEVLADGETFHIIRARESREDLIRHENIPDIT